MPLPTSRSSPLLTRATRWALRLSVGLFQQRESPKLELARALDLPLTDLAAGVSPSRCEPAPARSARRDRCFALCLLYFRRAQAALSRIPKAAVSRPRRSSDPAQIGSEVPPRSLAPQQMHHRDRSRDRQHTQLSTHSLPVAARPLIGSRRSISSFPCLLPFASRDPSSCSSLSPVETIPAIVSTRTEPVSHPPPSSNAPSRRLRPIPCVWCPGSQTPIPHPLLSRARSRASCAPQ